MRKSSEPTDLNGCASAFLRNEGEQFAGTTWQVFDAGNRTHPISHRPRLASSDPLVLMPAVIDGIGVALMPGSLCLREIDAGRLLRLLPQFHGGTMFLHAVFPSRQGLSKAARCFLDHLGQQLPPQLREALEHG